MPQRITDDTIIGDMIHQWTIPEYERHDRGPWWHIVVITIGLALVLYGMLSREGNFLFSLIIILGGIILFLQSRQEPLEVFFAITELGIIISDRFYPYSELKSFFIIYQPPEVKTLFLDTLSPFRPMIRIPILEMNPVELRHTLQEFLPEDLEQEDEPMSDMAARRWKIH
ncbi:MAG: hypothetical protein AAB932_05645 [Patescibacteria group bacterium]